MLPCVTKRRTMTNLRTKNNQNFQKIAPYGSPTTKELKKKHSSRPVGGVEMGIWGREDLQQAGSWRTVSERWHLVEQAVPYLHVDTLGGTSREQDRLHNPGLQHGEIMPQHL